MDWVTPKCAGHSTVTRVEPSYQYESWRVDDAVCVRIEKRTYLLRVIAITHEGYPVAKLDDRPVVLSHDIPNTVHHVGHFKKNIFGFRIFHPTESAAEAVLQRQ